MKEREDGMNGLPTMRLSSILLSFMANKTMGRQCQLLCRDNERLDSTDDGLDF
jgi:hypothetical protein